ncbi:MAG: prepilin-type N-terminal cleavage/methylation domain-containing protein [Phycisphaerae bacterium]|nr:prepilin-type N-terminal cleavage/methylation domain-containing protein [Phycisphaerae bacterium]
MDLNLSQCAKARGAFTLIELLVVVAIISLLIAIIAPALDLARQKATTIKANSNKRNIATSLNIFANDNSDRYPHSIASVGLVPPVGQTPDTSKWNWTDPRIMTGYDKYDYPRKSKGGYRSMSAYLKGYIEDPEALHCPSAPTKYKYLNESWEAADQWDNPDRIDPLDPMTGSYCFWWGYRGFLSDQGKVFKGPSRSSGGHDQSRMLLSDYFGSDTWRNIGKYGSCESFKNATVTASYPLYSDFYSGGDISRPPPEVKLNAVFTDGHVDSYDSSDVVTLEVSQRWDGTFPFDPIIRKGKFYLPRSAMP